MESYVSSALGGVIRTAGDRGLFEYAAASIDVNEPAGKRGARHVRQLKAAAARIGSALSALQLAALQDEWPPFVAAQVLSIRLS
jgi:hypothetical protein